MSKKNRALKIAATPVENDEISLAAALSEIETDEVSLTDASAVEAVVGEIETIESKHAAYAEQEAPAAPTIVEPKAPKAAKEKKVRVPRASMTSGLSASAVIKASVDDATIAKLLANVGDTATPEFVDAALAKIDSLDKKSREKATNLFTAVKAGRKPSTYVMQTLEALGGEPLNAKGLETYLLGRGYKVGTARRQASEMFALLPVTNIAIRDGGRGSTMSLNPLSSLFQAIKAI